MNEQFDINKNNFLEKALGVLGYDWHWIQWGFIDATIVADQFQSFQLNDMSAEHYRYAAFKTWIAEQCVLTDENIIQFIELARIDTDQMMACAAVVHLLRNPTIKDDHFDLLSVYLRSCSDKSLSMTVQRECYLRALRKKNDLTLTEFESYMGFADTPVQTYLLERFSPDNEAFLQVLIARGNNKAIRNIARQKLNRLKRHEK